MVSRYKINIQKFVEFLYTNNEIQKENIKKKNLLKSHQKNKILGINLTNEVKDLHAENYKTLIKETEGYSRKWKYIPCSWIRRFNIVKIDILPKAIYRLNVIPIRLP